jgi:hypothetical protein
VAGEAAGSQLAHKFFFEGASINDLSANYTRQELCDYQQHYVGEIESLIGGMTPEQLEYRAPGSPTGPDASGDEAHFNAQEIATHLAAGTAFYRWGITRALRHERPDFPRPPEGTRVTGTRGRPMGYGGWSGTSSPELVQLLHDTTEGFLTYVEGLPQDLGEEASSRYEPFGKLTVHSWLCLSVAHAAMHLKQLHEMQAQPDYPKASG